MAHSSRLFIFKDRGNRRTQTIYAFALHSKYAGRHYIPVSATMLSEAGYGFSRSDGRTIDHQRWGGPVVPPSLNPLRIRRYLVDHSRSFESDGVEYRVYQNTSSAARSVQDWSAERNAKDCRILINTLGLCGLLEVCVARWCALMKFHFFEIWKSTEK